MFVFPPIIDPEGAPTSINIKNPLPYFVSFSTFGIPSGMLIYYPNINLDSP